MSRRPKEATAERVATMLERAIEGSERLGMPDVADRYREMSVEEYAEEKGIRLINPSPKPGILPLKGSKIMSETVSLEKLKKDELVGEVEEAEAVMDEIWNALVDLEEDSSKDDLADGVFTVVELLNDYDAERFPIDEDEEEETPQDEADAT